MTTRDRLHRLVDVLADADDDEPESEDEHAGVAKAQADLAAGRALSAAEVRAALNP